MPSLNIDPNYPEHPKTRRLISLLGDMADALPIRLWAYCAKFHKRDGRMEGYSEREIEDAVLRWKGASGAAIAALVKVEYLRATDKGYECVDWREHEGHLEAFSRRAKEAARIRWHKDAISIRQASGKLSYTNAPTYPAVPTDPALQNREESNARARAKFTCPTIHEVRAYCQERGNAIDAQKWFDHYTANGWRVGRNPMRDWRAAIRTWETNHLAGNSVNDEIMARIQKTKDRVAAEGPR